MDELRRGGAQKPLFGGDDGDNESEFAVLAEPHAQFLAEFRRFARKLQRTLENQRLDEEQERRKQKRWQGDAFHERKIELRAAGKEEKDEEKVAEHLQLFGDHSRDEVLGQRDASDERAGFVAQAHRLRRERDAEAPAEHQPSTSRFSSSR